VVDHPGLPCFFGLVYHVFFRDDMLAPAARQDDGALVRRAATGNTTFHPCSFPPYSLLLTGPFETSFARGRTMAWCRCFLILWNILAVGPAQLNQ